MQGQRPPSRRSRSRSRDNASSVWLGGLELSAARRLARSVRVQTTRPRAFVVQVLLALGLADTLVRVLLVAFAELVAAELGVLLVAAVEGDVAATGPIARLSEVRAALAVSGVTEVVADTTGVGSPVAQSVGTPDAVGTSEAE